MKEIFDAVSQLGFPIVISLFLLIRLEGKMEKLNERIETLSDSINKLITIIDRKK